MSNYANLKSAIQSVIKTNGNNEITGQLLQNELLAMITTLGYGYQFMGVASPDTVPGTPDAKVFYIAYTPGTYTNFGGISVTGLCVLKYVSSWTKEDIPVSGGGGGTEFTVEPTDLTLVSGTPNKLKFADRIASISNKGYKILRADKTFAEQVTSDNTIYEIRDNFDLGGLTEGIANPISETATIDGTGYYLYGSISGRKGETLILPISRSNLVYKVIDSSKTSILNTSNTYTFEADGTVYIGFEYVSYWNPASIKYLLAANGIQLPNNCVLMFNGGSISNGCFVDSQFFVTGIRNNVFKNIYFANSAIDAREILVDWFDFVTDGTTDNYWKFQSLSSLVNKNGGCRVVFGNGKQYATSLVEFKRDNWNPDNHPILFRNATIDLDLNGSTIKLLPNNSVWGALLYFLNCNAYVHDGELIGDRQNHDYTAYTSYDGTQSTDFERLYNLSQEGGKMWIERVTSTYACGDGFNLGGVKFGGVSYHAEYYVRNCAISMCGRQGISCHSATKIEIKDTKISFIGEYDNLPGYAPKSGIDFEFLDGIPDKPFVSLERLVIEDCSKTGIVMASNNTLFSDFVCKDCIFTRAPLYVGQLKESGNAGNKLFEDCVITDSDTDQSNVQHLLGGDFVRCQFKGLRWMGTYPDSFVDCFISTTSNASKISNSTAFPRGGSAVFPKTRGSKIVINVGFIILSGNNDSFCDNEIVINSTTSPRIANFTFTRCRIVTETSNSHGMSNANLTKSGFRFVDCDIQWHGSGTSGFTGYDLDVLVELSGCRLKNTRICMSTSRMRADNCHFDSCEIANYSGGTSEPSIISNSTLINCKGHYTKKVTYANCEIIDDQVADKAGQLGISGTSSTNGKDVFINCRIKASNFTSPTTATYSEYSGCDIDIADGDLTGAVIYNSLVRSTIDNAATTFENSVYLKNGVIVQ